MGKDAEVQTTEIRAKSKTWDEKSKGGHPAAEADLHLEGTETLPVVRPSAGPASASAPCVVNSYTEWDPLEEIVVGRIENSVFPPYHPYVLGGCPEGLYTFMRFIGGFRRWPEGVFVEPAVKELEEFVRVLEGEGIKVRRPDVMNHRKSFKTPDWSSTGYTTACPRDCFMVIGDEIIEAPMSWRCRTYERQAYYSLFKEYFENGARWTSAPRPPLLDSLYDQNYTVPRDDEPVRYVINESEVVFDAADFMRCGRDLFVTRSNVTNAAGIAWLRRHLGDGYRIHELETKSKQPMHIDTTFVPLGPGKAMINPKYMDRAKLPAALRTWDIFEAPTPVDVKGGFATEHAAMCSLWLNMNVLLLDERRVVVERSQEPMIAALKKWGMTPIPCTLQYFNPYGGAFHCVTLDIRRRGGLQSYC